MKSSSPMIIDSLARYINGIGDSLHRKNETKALEYALKAQDIILSNFPPKSPHSSSDFNLLFKNFYRILDIRSNELFVETFCSYIITAYGEQHVVLSDLYSTIAASYTKSGKLTDALEYSGRALVIRMETLGLMEDKTAESHFNLGLIYRFIGDFAQSRKQLRICRNIRIKLFGHESLPVANCDLNIANTEKAANSTSTAYFYYYSCLRTRIAILGKDHPQTIIAYQMLMESNSVNGMRHYCANELRDRVLELQWADGQVFGYYSYEYSISLFVNKLHVEDVLTENQVRALVTKSIKFSASKQSSSTSPLRLSSSASSIDDSSLEDTMKYFSDSLMATSLPLTPKERSQLIIRLQNNKESMERKTSSSSSLAELISPGDSSRSEYRWSSSGTVSPMNQSFGLSLNSPAGTITPLPSSETINSTTSPVHETVQIPVNKNLLETEFNEKMVIYEPSSEPVLIPVHVPVLFPAPDPVNVPPELPVMKDETASSSVETKESIDVVSITQDISILRTSAIAIKSGTYNSTIDSVPSLQFYVGNHVTLLTKDSSGNRVVIRRSSAEDIVDNISPKVHVLGLLSLLLDKAKGIKTKIPSHDATSREKTLSEPVASLKVEESSKNLEIANRSKNAAKLALTALFSKKPAENQTPPTSGGDEPSGKNTTGLENVKVEEANQKLIPQPPPLPTTWPPVPFKQADAGEPVGGLSSSALLLGADGSFPSSSLVTRKSAPTKIKQLNVDSIVNIEGTIWGDNLESFLPVEELFHDMVKEFEIVAVKPSKSGIGIKDPASKAKSKPKPEGVLDPQRSQNISIMLAKFGRRTVPEIAKGIISFDAESMGAQAVTSLLQYLPTPDETKAMKKYLTKLEKEDPVKLKSLPKAEEYFIEMSKITNCEERLSAMYTCLTAQEVVQTVQGNAELMMKAVDEVKGSSRLKYIFKAILDLTNILVAKENDQQMLSTGFSLNSLIKLSGMKTNSGETAEQYIVSRIHFHMPEALDLGTDMPSLDNARQVLFPRLRADLNRLATGLEVMKRLSENVDEPEDSLAKITAHLERLTMIHTTAATALKDAENDFKVMCRYLGEEDPTSDPEKVFGKISKFVSSVASCTTVAIAKQKKKNRDRLSISK